MFNKSIIRIYFAASICFGILMGIIFPFYTNFFVTYKNQYYLVIYVAGCIIAGIIVGAFSFYIGHITIIRLLKKISLQLNNIAKKEADLTTKLHINSNDEIGRLADNYNSFVSTLNNIIKMIKDSIRDSRNISLNLNSCSEKSSSSMKEIISNVETIKDKANSSMDEINNSMDFFVELNNFTLKFNELIKDQSFNINRSTESIKRVTSSIHHISQKTIEKTEVVNKLKILAESGGNKMSETIQMINKIKDSTNIIMDMLLVINKINSQTNLLAMNAAIEAAHAGEAGKGFTIVADEIRKLAEDTASNSKDISSSLKNVIEYIGHSVDYSKKTGEYFQDIVIGVTGLAESMFEIENTMNDLSNSNDDIMENLESLINSNSKVMESSNQMHDRIISIKKSLENINTKSVNTKKSIDDIALQG